MVKRPGDRLHRGRAVGHQGDPVLSQLKVPAAQRLATSRAAADPGDQRVALGQGLGVGSPRSGPGGPQGGDELVQVGPAQRGRTFDELEPVGQEHADQGSRLNVEHALHGGTVGAHPLGFSGRVADGQLMGTVLGHGVDHHTRSPLAKPHDLTLVGGATGAAGAAEVQSFDQICLPGAVGAGDHGQALAELHAGTLVGAKVTHRDAHHPHRRTLN